MPSKEILREILDTLNESGIHPIAIENIPEWNGDNARQYAEALSWLNDNFLIETTEDEQLYDNKQHEFFSAKINSRGREFLENNCEFERPQIDVRLDDAQFQALLLSVAEKVGNKKDVSILKSFIGKSGTAALNAFMSESVKLGLANLTTIMSKF